MTCMITGSGKGYTHRETQTWEITGPSASGQDWVFPALWSATGSGSASKQSPDMKWNASWTVSASKQVRLAIEPVGPDQDRWRFVNWSAQARQDGGVTGTQTTQVTGQRSKTSPISQTAFEAILGAPQYQARDLTDVVAGRVTSDQAVGNMGLGVPAGATFTAEWTWKFIPQRTKVTLRVVDGAVQPDVKIPTAWAAVRDASRSVIVEATTFPDNSPAEWNRIQWSGPGEKINGAPNRRRLSRSSAGRLTVAASLDNSRDEIDVWVLWAEVEVRTSGLRPANAAPFPQGQDGTDKLGAVKYLLPTFSVIDPVTGEVTQNMGAAGKVCVVVTILPKNASDIVSSGWAIKRELQCHTWQSGLKVTTPKKLWTDEWVDDTSGPALLRLTPDGEGRIYDLDAPNMAQGEKTYETYTNFRQLVTWNTEPCSDFARWHWNCRWKLDRDPNRQIEQADVSLGNLALPAKSHYPRA
jgi:hypothetical protein